MIVRKFWLERGKYKTTTLGFMYYKGYFLFGFIPIYITQIGESEYYKNM